MKNPQSGRDQRGFTLIEMLVVLALVAILMFISAPAIYNAVRQSKLRGITQEVTTLMRQARLDAIKSSAQAVVRIVPADATNPIPSVQAFSDRNADGLLSAGEPVLATFPLPKGVTFTAPDLTVDANSVSGFSPDAGGAALPKVALFQRDGSIAAVGAFRFADQNQNFLEVRVEPAATARIEVHKWQGGAWISNGDGGKAWQWN
jgi:prepilin-type N-terminal cleavage/methylation domain-containing protein